MGLPAPSLKVRALRLLAQREHSRAELAAKLRRHLPDDDTGGEPIERLLDELVGRGLLDEQRAAESVVRRGAARYGERRLKQSLQAKGFPAERVGEALAAARPGELDRAREVWNRRFGTLAADAGERARQARFLAGRGFSTDVILRIVKGLDDPGA